jgi:hypothetical protein
VYSNHTEEAAMTRYGKLLVPVALLAAAVCAAPSRAEDESTAQKLARIERQLRDVQVTLDRINDTLKDTGLTANKATIDLKELERRVEAIHRLVVAHDDALRRSSRSFSYTPGYTPGQAGTGTIRLENRSAESATITVNGTPYFLLPGEVRTLPNQPAGTFTWEASTPQHGVIRPTTTRTLQPGEVYTLFVAPPTPVFVPG